MPQPARLVTLLALAVVGLAFVLRLRDPFLSPVLAAEDPYLNLYRAERWASKGVAPTDYLPGFPALLVAAQAFGLPLYDLARVAPAWWGALGTAGMFLLARRLGGHVAGLGAALLFAAIPELVQRGDLLAPTALDLALVPLAGWCAVDLSLGQLRSLPWLGLMVAWLVPSHPWGLLYLAVALAPFGVRLLWRWPFPLRRARAPLLGALALGGLAMVVVLQGPDTGESPLGSLASRAGAWLAQPSLAYTPPRWVDPVAMLGWPAMLLGALGAWKGPRELRWLGLSWVLVLLPVASLDLTSVAYAPQRTVAFLAPGLALLGGAACAWLARSLAATRVWGTGPLVRRVPIVAVAALLVLAAAAPGATAKPWWRNYRAEEQAMVQGLCEQEQAWIIVGSWQAGALWGAWGCDVRAMPGFFRSAAYRDDVAEEARQGGLALYIVIDPHTANKAKPAHNAYARYNLSFLEGLEPPAVKADRTRVYVGTWLNSTS